MLFLDLDCRFDISRFSQMLIHRITEPYRSNHFPFASVSVSVLSPYIKFMTMFLAMLVIERKKGKKKKNQFEMMFICFYLDDGTGEANANGDYDKALYDLCMRRFLYARCSSSFEFLQTLKVIKPYQYL